jgi:calnexin
MQNNILFDNIYIGHSEEDAKKFAEETWAIKYKIEKDAEDLVSKPESEEVCIFAFYVS